MGTKIKGLSKIGCFGTKQYNKGSSICKICKLKELCAKQKVNALKRWWNKDVACKR